jgi:hypothetical protein
MAVLFQAAWLFYYNGDANQPHNSYFTLRRLRRTVVVPFNKPPKGCFITMEIRINHTIVILFYGVCVEL